MKVCVLSSGSKGNTTYVETGNVKILIDAGNNCKYIQEKLNNINVELNGLDAILITHIHTDHINGLKTLVKKTSAVIYLTDTMRNYLDFVNNYYLIDSNNFLINGVSIETIKTSHDTEESLGYIISDDNSSMVYITDTGYINQKYFELLKNRNLYIMESNHDIEMLNHSSYPFALRQRILSDKGHLSNYDSARYLAKFIGNNTKWVVLAHLSEENNTPEIAYETLTDRLVKDNILFNNIIVAEQNKETELFNI